MSYCSNYHNCISMSKISCSLLSLSLSLSLSPSLYLCHSVYQNAILSPILCYFPRLLYQHVSVVHALVLPHSLPPLFLSHFPPSTSQSQIPRPCTIQCDSRHSYIPSCPALQHSSTDNIHLNYVENPRHVAPILMGRVWGCWVGEE